MAAPMCCYLRQLSGPAAAPCVCASPRMLSSRWGAQCERMATSRAVLPAGYYARVVPGLLRTDPRALSPLRRAELDRFGAACRTNPELAGMVQTPPEKSWAKAVYQRICANQKNRKKKAIIAVARKLLVRCWAMLVHETPWNEAATTLSEAAPA